MNNLRESAGRALIWDLIGNFGGQLITFFISIILARLLSPADFGLVGMAMVFIFVCQIFVDFGFASALIQNKSNTSLTYSSVFYINVLAGILLNILLFISAPYIGKFYDSEPIVAVIQLLSFIFLFSSFSTTQVAILKKELDFKHLTIRQIISEVLGGILGIVLAFSNYGVLAIVAQRLTATFINSILIWHISHWRPQWEFSWIEVRQLFSFSSFVFFSQLTNQLVVQADTLVIGKLFSASTLGFFSRAKSLNGLITRNSVSSLNKVFFPVLSKINDDPEKFKAVYIRLLGIGSGLSVLLAGAFYLCGPELIIGLFGEKWEPSIFIFQILVIKSLFLPISSMIVNAFLAIGKSKENFKYGNIRKLIQLLPLVIAYLYGFEAYLYSLITVSLVNALLNNYFVSLELNVSLADQMKIVIIPLLFALALVTIITSVWPVGFSYFSALLKVIIFSTAYLSLMYFAKTTFINEFSFLFNSINGII